MVKNQNLPTFNDYPVTFSMGPNDEVYVDCKGVKGSLSESEAFLNRDGDDGEYSFGIAKITRIKNIVHVDCLSDTIKKFEYLVKKARQFKIENTK